jgi:hypothetical protein
MKRISGFIVAIALVGLLVSRVHGAGGNTWAAGYPKASTMAGTILVKGTATADTGYTFTGTGQVAYWPVGGGQVQTTTITVNGNGTWGESPVSGLTTGTTYNVVVQVNEKSGMTTVTLATDPAQVKAP